MSVSTPERSDSRTTRARHRRQVHDRQAAIYRAAAAVDPLPLPEDAELRRACHTDLHRFLVEHFPQSTGQIPFGDDHRRFIGRIQRAITNAGRYVNVIFRGGAKTTISQNSAIWAVLHGYSLYAFLFGATGDDGEQNMRSIRAELEENDRLAAQYPEVCLPIRALEGKPQRAAHQTYEGEPTHVVWQSKAIVLPTIPAERLPEGWPDDVPTAATGAVIRSRGITGAMRGMVYKLPDGRNVRPDLFIGDDLQTDESAIQPGQVQKRYDILTRGVLKMAGHRKQAACVVNGTPIAPNDLIETLTDPVKSPAWQCERIPMVHKWADAHESFWLTKYAETRNTFNREDLDDQMRARNEATELYRQNRDMADAGCVVAWDGCYDPERELSAIQHAYNLLIDDGADVFDAECQCKPRLRQQENPLLKAEDLSKRTIKLARGHAPADAQIAVTMIDVQDEYLFYTTYAGRLDYTGVFAEYGTWPDFQKRYWSRWQANGWALASKSFFAKYPQHVGRAERTDSGGIKAPFEAKIYFMLQQLVPQLLNKRLPRANDTAAMPLNLVAIDARWGKASDVIKRFIQDLGRQDVIAYMGQPVPPTRKQFEDYTRTAGWLFEDQVHRGLREVKWVWRPGPDGRYYFAADVNRLKTFLMQRLSCPPGSPGAIMLHDAPAGGHDLFADHIAGSEYPQDVSANGLTKEIWQSRDGSPDNEGLDCAAACMALASRVGARLQSDPEGKPPATTQRRRRSLRDKWNARHGR